MKKILLVTDFAYPVRAGTERLVFNLAKFINQTKEYHADILCPKWNPELKPEQTIDGVTIFAFETHEISQAKPVNRIIDFVKTIRKLQAYDIYQGFYTVPPLIATVLAAKLKHKKSIITFFARDQLENNLKTPLHKAIIVSLLKAADQITTYTWILEKRFKELYFPNKNIVTIQGWSETNFKKIPTKKEKQNIVLFVGRINESKGVFVLLNAFARVQKRINAKLVLIGPPYEKDRAEQEIKNLGLQENVLLLGFVSNETLNEWYNKADIVAVPALHPDGFGLSLMEAIACGKPVISTASVGAPENKGYEELIIEPGNTEQLAALLEKFFSDNAFRKKFEKSYNAMAELFDKEKVLNKYIELYDSLLK